MDRKNAYGDDDRLPSECLTGEQLDGLVKSIKKAVLNVSGKFA